MELLIWPTSEPVSADSLLENALAYVERFQGAVLPLEHAWDVLAAALCRAWQGKERYEAVMRLATALTPLRGK